MCQLVGDVLKVEKDRPDREQGREVSPARVQSDEDDVLVGESEDESDKHTCTAGVGGCRTCLRCEYMIMYTPALG